MSGSVQSATRHGVPVHVRAGLLLSVSTLTWPGGPHLHHQHSTASKSSVFYTRTSFSVRGTPSSA
jgi:hypothetical protein